MIIFIFLLTMVLMIITFHVNAHYQDGKNEASYFYQRYQDLKNKKRK